MLSGLTFWINAYQVAIRAIWVLANRVSRQGLVHCYEYHGCNCYQNDNCLDHVLLIHDLLHCLVLARSILLASFHLLIELLVFSSHSPIRMTAPEEFVFVFTVGSPR